MSAISHMNHAANSKHSATKFHSNSNSNSPMRRRRTVSHSPSARRIGENFDQNTNFHRKESRSLSRCPSNVSTLSRKHTARKTICHSPSGDLTRSPSNYRRGSSHRDSLSRSPSLPRRASHRESFAHRIAHHNEILNQLNRSPSNFSRQNSVLSRSPSPLSRRSEGRDGRSPTFFVRGDSESSVSSICLLLSHNHSLNFLTKSMIIQFWLFPLKSWPIHQYQVYEIFMNQNYQSKII